MDQFGWSREDTIRNLGIAMATGGITAGLIFTIAIPHTKKFDNRKTLLFCGIIPFIISKLVILPMGDTYPPFVHNETNHDGNNFRFILFMCSINAVFKSKRCIPK